MAGVGISLCSRRSFSRIFGAPQLGSLALELHDQLLDLEAAAGWLAGRAVGCDRSVLRARNPYSVGRSCSRSCARHRTRGTAPPSSRHRAGGLQIGDVHPFCNTPARALCAPAKCRKCYLCVRNEVLPLSQEGQRTYERQARSFCRAAGPLRDHLSTGRDASGIGDAQYGARLLAIQEQVRLLEQAADIGTRVMAGHRMIGVAE